MIGYHVSCTLQDVHRHIIFFFRRNNSFVSSFGRCLSELKFIIQRKFGTNPASNVPVFFMFALGYHYTRWSKLLSPLILQETLWLGWKWGWWLLNVRIVLDQPDMNFDGKFSRYSWLRSDKKCSEISKITVGQLNYTIKIPQYWYSKNVGYVTLSKVLFSEILVWQPGCYLEWVITTGISWDTREWANAIQIIAEYYRLMCLKILACF